MSVPSQRSATEVTTGVEAPRVRARPTRWLEPRLLLRSAVQVVVSSVLGQYNDKRELMGSLPADPPLDLSAATDTDTGDDGVWVDYVSDTGDGFDATYSVAHLLGRPELMLGVAGAAARRLTRRGRLLVMGGDQCYPSADVETYEDRLLGPYRAALPRVEDEDRAPHLLVVPGNHDWYDGLTAFMRTFCQRRWIGGWRTGQSRSYFAAKLPGRWWLWGIDIQFDTYIDDVQRRYFEEMAARLEPGDAVVLCSAKPSWVSTAEDDLEAYATLDFLERTLIRPRGASVRLAISGDRHHYARYEAADGAQKITAGGGGAYLSPTHHLPGEIVVPPAASRARGKSDPVRYERRGVYPDPRTSRRLGWGILRLPVLTPSLAALLGGVYAALGLAVASALTPPVHGLGDQLAAIAATLRAAEVGELAGGLAGSLAALLLSVLVVGGAVGFAGTAKTGRARRARGVAAGALHGAAHLALAVGSTAAAARLLTDLPGAWLTVAVVPLVVVGGGALAALLVAAYLLVADRIGLNSNELFAGQAVPDYKSFLRLHVKPDAVTVYAVGVDRVPRSWPEFEPGGAGASEPGASRLRPVLIEEPIRVPAQPLGAELLPAAAAGPRDA